MFPEHSEVHIYAAYRRHMTRKYGPGPWGKIALQDRFPVWRARLLGEHLEGLDEEPDKGEGFFVPMRKGGSSGGRSRGKKKPLKRYYPLPPTLA